MSFPKIIHLFPNTDTSWKTLNPSFNFINWDLPSISSLFENNLPNFLTTFNSLKSDTQKFNMGKYAILYHHGGIVADTGTKCIKNFDNLLNEYNNTDFQLLVSYTNNLFDKIKFMILLIESNPYKKHIIDSIIIAKPNCNILLMMLDSIKFKNDENYLYFIKSFDELTKSGYLNFSNIVQIDDNLKITKLLPPSYFSYNNAIYATYPKNDSQSLNIIFITLILLFILSIYLINKYFGTKTTTYSLLAILIGWITKISEAYHTAYICDKLGCNADVLPDRGFDLIPNYIDDNSPLGYFVFFAPTILLITLLSLAFLKFKKDEGVRNVILIQIILTFFFRLITFNSIGLPPPKQNVIKNGIMAHFFDGFRKNLDTPVTGHTDMLFSGHVSVFTFSMLWLLKMTRNNSLILKTSVIICILLYSISIISIRYHYTVDVLFAVVLSSLLFNVLFTNVYKKKMLK